MDNIKGSLITAKATIDRSHYQTIIKVDNHIVIADEPIAVGGQETGASPRGLLLASLGSCTAITLRMYIDRKMWAVDEITIGLELFGMPGETLIEQRLSFKGDLNNDQRKRLVQIANACPIHKILAGSIRIETELV